jgi:hypothetical protein
MSGLRANIVAAKKTLPRERFFYIFTPIGRQEPLPIGQISVIEHALDNCLLVCVCVEFVYTHIPKETLYPW